MADLVRYVNTASSAGGDGTTNNTSGGTRAYASLSAAEAALNQNLTDAGGDTMTILCCGSAADTANVIIDGWTTGASNWLLIKGNPDDSAGRHEGKWSTSHYRLSVTDPAGGLACFEQYESFVRFEGIQIEVSRSSTGTRRCFYVEVGTDIRWESCILRQNPSSSGSGNLIGIGLAGNIGVKITNTLFTGFRQGTGQGFADFSSGSSGVVYNCGAYDCDVGFNTSTSAGIRIRNTWVQSSTDGFQGTWHSDSAKNISNVASDAPGTGSKQATVTFVDAAGGDFHLAAGDTEAFDFGDDLSADATFPFSLDIDGDTRTDWSCGPDERVVAGGGLSIPIVNHHRRMLMAA